MSTNPFTSNPGPANPYVPPTMAGGYVAPAPPQRRLADLGKRFLGALLDGVAALVFLVPGLALIMLAAAAAGGNDEPPPLFFVGLFAVLIGGLASLGVQIYFLATRSQSIGKYLMKTQIVDYMTGQPATFVQTILLRIFVNGLIAGVPCVGGIYALVDILFIFSDDHRCLHDKIANTIVVDIS